MPRPENVSGFSTRDTRRRAPHRMTLRHVAARAYAKVNLDLRVFGRRTDGTHELRTVLQAIDLHDSLTFESRHGGFEIRSTDPRVPRDATNLVWQAAERLWRAAGQAGTPENVHATIDKRIPLQSGLGGGSTDAAAALRALDRLWQFETTATTMQALAADLGADVPFFLSGGTALGIGRGHEVSPLVDFPRSWFVLLVPPFGISTADAYAWYDQAPKSDTARPHQPLALPEYQLSHLVQMVNDLEAPVIQRSPELSEMKAALLAQGAVAASLSGSGSTVYGLFRQRTDAERAATTLAESGLRVILVETLSRGEYTTRNALHCT